MPNFGYRVLQIENISHSLSIPEGYTEAELQGKLQGKNQYKASFSPDSEIVIIAVHSELQLKGSDTTLPQQQIFQIEVRSVFLVPSLRNYLIDDGEDIKPEVAEYLLDLAIAHTRGVQSTIISGTPISKSLIQG